MGLRRAVVLGAVAVAALPLVLLAAFLVGRQYQEGVERAAGARVTLAQAAAATTAAFVAGHLSTVQTLAQTPAVRDPARIPDPDAYADNLLAANPAWDSIGLFDAQGSNLLSSTAAARSVNVGDRAYFAQVMASDRPVVSDALTGRVSGERVVVLAAPVDFADGGRGVVAVGVRASRLAAEVGALPNMAGVAVEIVDRQGDPVIRTDGAGDEVGTGIARDDVAAALAGESAAGVLSNDGREELVAYAPVRPQGWGVLLREPTAAAFAEVRRGAFAFGGLAGLALLAGAIVNWVLSGRLVLFYDRAREAQERAERGAARTARLQELTAGLAAAVELADVERVVVDGARAALGARQAVLGVLADGGCDPRVVAAAGDEPAPTEGPGAVLAGAVREGRVVRVEEASQPSGAAARTGGSWLAVPLQADGRPVGALGLLFAEPRAPTGDDEQFVAVLARVCAQALERARLHRRAQDAIRARDEVLGAVTHDLRAPLTTIRGNAQLLLRRLGDVAPEVASRLRDGLMQIEAATTRAHQQVQELVDAARMQAGRPLELQRRPADLVAIVRRAVEAQPPDVQARVWVEAQPASLVGEWDGLRLARVVENLLGNAVKYSPEESRVDVRVVREGDEAVLAVRDAGVGIPAGELDRVFGWYQRGSNVAATIPGTGVGLAGARRIVEQHGGSIAVESREGAGSTFTVRLPLADRSGAAGAATPASV